MPPIAAPVLRGDGAMPLVPYRLGFAVKVLGAPEPLKEADRRRWQSGPHLRHSIEMLHRVWDHLVRIDVRMYRMSSNVIPYGSHPDLPQFDYRRQIAECGPELDALGDRTRRLGLRLSMHPGQYTVINGADEGIRDRSLAEIEANAAMLDALGCGSEATVVVHVGGLYGDRAASIERWARAWELLSDQHAPGSAWRMTSVCSPSRTSWSCTGSPASAWCTTTTTRASTPPRIWHPARRSRRRWRRGRKALRPKVHLSSPKLTVEHVRRPIPGTRSESRRRRDAEPRTARGPCCAVGLPRPRATRAGSHRRDARGEGKGRRTPLAPTPARVRGTGRRCGRGARSALILWRQRPHGLASPGTLRSNGERDSRADPTDRR